MGKKAFLLPVALVAMMFGIVNNLPAADGVSPAAMRPGGGFFVGNAGQYPPEILFYSDISGGRLWVREQDLVISIIEPEPPEERRERLGRRHERWIELERCEREPMPRRISNVYVTFPDGEFSNITAEEPCITKINIFKGNDPAKWHTEIPTFGVVRVVGLADGVDLVLDASAATGAPWYLERAGDASTPSLEPVFSTSGRVSHKEAGTLIETAAGSVIVPFLFPFSENPIVDRVNEVPYDTSEADSQKDTNTQTLLWGTYLGGTLEEGARALALSNSGCIVVAGNTNSPDIPVPGGYDNSLDGVYGDIYIAGFSESGASLLWATYLGGTNFDNPHALSYDSLYWFSRKWTVASFHSCSGGSSYTS